VNECHIRDIEKFPPTQSNSAMPPTHWFSRKPKKNRDEYPRVVNTRSEQYYRMYDGLTKQEDALREELAQLPKSYRGMTDRKGNPITDAQIQTMIIRAEEQLAEIQRQKKEIAGLMGFVERMGGVSFSDAADQVRKDREEAYESLSEGDSMSDQVRKDREESLSEGDSMSSQDESSDNGSP
jgi:hypothetical protein